MGNSCHFTMLYPWYIHHLFLKDFMVDLIWFDVLRLSRTASKDHLIAEGNFA
jgi:hypothetical protein